MIIVREHIHNGPHVVHHNREPLKQGIDGLTGEMSEILVLSPVSRIHPSLNLSIPNMSFLQHLSNFTSQALRVHPIEFRLTQHETSSRPPCCWRRTCPLILERGSSMTGHSLCPLWHPKGSNPFCGGTLPSTYSTSGSFCHRSVEDLNPVPGTPSLDLRLVRVNQDP
jgi:hypothetical protein